MEKGLVSIIIPCYNYGNFLTETVESVIHQTYPNWECIIIDDGSTDDSEEIGKMLEKKDKRIRYMYQENQGLTATRKRGFNESNGEFIQFLDADDLIDKNKFKEQLEIFNKNRSIGVCYTNYQTFDSNPGNLTGRYLNVILGENPLEDFLFKWERGLSIPIHCALFKRSVFENVNVFNVSLKAKEDWYLWVCLALEGVKFYFLDKDYAFYRLHSNNMCNDHVKMMFYMMKAISNISEKLPDTYKKVFEEESLKHLKLHYVEKILINPLLYSALYIDTGNGFNENEYIRQALNFSEGKYFRISYDLKGSRNIKKICFIPVECRFCRLKINNILLKTPHELKEIKFSEINPVLITNGEKLKDGYIDFATLNPQVILLISDELRQLTIEGEIRIYETADRVNQIINRIYNSYTWRAGRVITWLPEMLVNNLKKFIAMFT